ncbi:MAG: hypothetical protein ACLRJV_20615 [Eubacteriales bacterium]
MRPGPGHNWEHPALAAEADTGESARYYPISVEEYTYGEAEEPRINKVYQLSLSDDPSGIPRSDFVRNGRLYYLLDMTRKDEVGVDTKPHTETVTRPSDTDNMEEILQGLEAELEVTTEEGYIGVLRLDHTSVQVTTDGYATKTRNLSATRTYPNLSDADLALIPKSIEDNGKELTLADVQWSSSEQTDGAGGTVTVHRYSQLHRHQQLPIRHRLHSHCQLHRRGGQDRLQRSDLYRHLRQYGGPGGVHRA